MIRSGLTLLFVLFVCGFSATPAVAQEARAERSILRLALQQDEWDDDGWGTRRATDDGWDPPRDDDDGWDPRRDDDDDDRSRPDRDFGADDEADREREAEPEYEEEEEEEEEEPEPVVWFWHGASAIHGGASIGTYTDDLGLDGDAFLVDLAYTEVYRESDSFGWGWTGSLGFGSFSVGGPRDAIIVSIAGSIDFDFLVTDSPDFALTVGLGARLLGLEWISLQASKDVFFPIGITLPVRAYFGSLFIRVEAFFGILVGLSSETDAIPENLDAFEVSVSVGYIFGAD